MKIGTTIRALYVPYPNIKQKKQNKTEQNIQLATGSLGDSCRLANVAGYVAAVESGGIDSSGALSGLPEYGG